MSDLIKDLERALRDNKFIEMDSSAFECICDIIESIPSAERKGEWIKSETDGFICSACGSGYRDQPTCMGKPMFEYCPVCGARMKGAEDETD